MATYTATNAEEFQSFLNEDSELTGGDTLLVEPGVYTGNFTIEKSGEDGNPITIQANGEPGSVILRDPEPTVGGFREGVIQSAGQENLNIEGFRIEDTSWAGISIRDGRNITVENNQTENTGASGIIALPDTEFGGGEAEITSSNIKILNNEITDANARWTGGRGNTTGDQEALSVWGVDGFEVAGNKVNGATREGIDIKVGSRNGTVHDNEVEGAASISGLPSGYQGGPAIYLDGNRADMKNIEVFNNVVKNNTADGIVVADEEKGIGKVSGIKIYDNLVYGNGILGTNGGVGIGVNSNVADVEIRDNTLADNVNNLNVVRDNLAGEGDRPTDIVVEDNIIANGQFKNAIIDDADVTLRDNFITTEFDPLYDSNDVSNVNEEGTIEGESAGFNGDGDYSLASDSEAAGKGANLSAAGDSGESETGEVASNADGMSPEADSTTDDAVEEGAENPEMPEDESDADGMSPEADSTTDDAVEEGAENPEMPEDESDADGMSPEADSTTDDAVEEGAENPEMPEDGSDVDGMSPEADSTTDDAVEKGAENLDMPEDGSDADGMNSEADNLDDPATIGNVVEDALEGSALENSEDAAGMDGGKPFASLDPTTTSDSADGTENINISVDDIAGSEGTSPSGFDLNNRQSVAEGNNSNLFEEIGQQIVSNFNYGEDLLDGEVTLEVIEDIGEQLVFGLFESGANDSGIQEEGQPLATVTVDYGDADLSALTDSSNG